MVSNAHMVAAKGRFIAIVSTTVETNKPLSEVNAGIGLLGPIMERFDSVSDILSPLGDGTRDKCFISSSYDATRYFMQYFIMYLELFNMNYLYVVTLKLPLKMCLAYMKELRVNNLT
jgi:RAB protein geranylgeranyltransferase component A